MNRFVLPVIAAALLAVVSLSVAEQARAASATPPAVPAPRATPGNPEPRSGDFHVLGHGEKAISAKCEDGGFVFVPNHPAPDHRAPVSRRDHGTQGLSAERSDAIRDACTSVDYSK